MKYTLRVHVGMENRVKSRGHSLGEKLMKKLWLLVVVTLIAGGCAKHDEQAAIAVVGDKEIPLYEITEDFEQIGMPEFPSPEEELKAKREYLNGRIDDVLLAKAGYAFGLDTDLEIMELVEKERDKFLLDELFRVEIIEKSKVEEKELREWYKYWFQSIRARHILVESKAEADSLRQAIIDGADFGAVARDNSKDPLSRSRGGDLGRTYRWGDLVEPFQTVLFNLKTDDISEPLKTEYGWHIIELLEKTELKEKPFDEVREAIETKIKSIKQRDRQLAHRDELKQLYPITLVPETIAFLRDKIGEYAKVDTVDIPDSLRRDVPIDFLSELEREKPFAHYLTDQVVTLGQYLQGVNPQPLDIKPALENEETLKEFVLQSVLYALLIDQATNLGLMDAPLYQKRIKEFTEQMMTEKMKTQVLRRGISVTESEMENHFNKNAGQYKTDLMLGVREIQVATKAQADDLRRQLVRGADFIELAKANTQRRGSKRNGGDLGYIKEFRYPVIYKVADTMKVGQLSMPFQAEEDDTWSIIVLVERQEVMPKTFDDVKGEIYKELREARIDSVYNAYTDSLRAVTPITIDEDLLTESIDREKYKNRLTADTQTGDNP